jgi:hypothetical protein
VYPGGGYLSRHLKSKKLHEFFDSTREVELDLLENTIVKWCREDSNLSKLDVVGSITRPPLDLFKNLETVRESGRFVVVRCSNSVNASRGWSVSWNIVNRTCIPHVQGSSSLDDFAV